MAQKRRLRCAFIVYLYSTSWTMRQLSAFEYSKSFKRKLECKSKRNAAGLSATIAFTPSDCRRFPAGPVAFSRTGRARNAPKHGIRASAGHAHASPAQSFAGLSATPVWFSLPGRFFRLFSPVNYLLPPSRDGFRTTSSGLIRTIPSSPSRSLGRSLEAACRGVFPPRLLLG